MSVIVYAFEAFIQHLVHPIGWILALASIFMGYERWHWIVAVIAALLSCLIMIALMAGISGDALFGSTRSLAAQMMAIQLTIGLSAYAIGRALASWTRARG